ncbi:MAG TPA: glycosyltransferase [Polyangiaceae bacterium]|nr:glycosyltransferase [Polyangiaceae bacterium]
MNALAPNPGPSRRVAYLVNHYPKVSHSFIRREILALERRGLEVLRFSVRGADDRLVDEEDQRERTKTRYLLAGGGAGLLLALTLTALTRPFALLRALGQARRLASGSERSFLHHMAYLAEACLLLRWLGKQRVEHLHAHFGTNSAEVAQLTHALGGPRYSFTVHGPEEFDKPGSLGLAQKASHAHAVVAISSFGKSQLQRWLRYEDWSKLHVVHCGLEPSFHQVPATPPAERPRFVCVGRLCEQKGQLTLLEACAVLKRRNVDFELVLAGDGEMREVIEQRIAQLNLGAQVTITGWISSGRVREELLACRALVMPSFAEGLPVAIMESLALRRPVVSTYVAGIPELVRPGSEGWLVPAGDPVALADALAECATATVDSLTAMGERGYARVLERHDVDREATKLTHVFDLELSPEVLR